MTEMFIFFAYHDPLTKLANRRAFYERADQALLSSSMLSLLIIDLAGFKAVNDTYGHQIGEYFLTHLGGLLEASTRDVGLASRVGGDEFYIYLVDLTESDVLAFIHELQMTLNQNPYHTSDVTIPICASIGVSHAPDHGTNLDTLIHKADQAMYQIKQDGKNDYAIYDEALHGPK